MLSHVSVGIALLGIFLSSFWVASYKDIRSEDIYKNCLASSQLGCITGLCVRLTEQFNRLKSLFLS